MASSVSSTIGYQTLSAIKEVRKDTSQIRQDIQSQIQPEAASSSPYWKDRNGENKTLLHNSLQEGEWKKVPTYNSQGKLII